MHSFRKRFYYKYGMNPTIIIISYWNGISFANNLFFETLSEIKGFVDSITFSNISDLNLCAVGLIMNYRNNINFTYERDDGLVRSWPDQVLTLVHHSSVNVKSIHLVLDYAWGHFQIQFQGERQNERSSQEQRNNIYLLLAVASSVSSSLPHLK